MITREQLNSIREKTRAKIELGTGDKKLRVVVGMATCGIAAGAGPVLSAIKQELSAAGNEDVFVTLTGCIGVCRLEPIVEVHSPDGKKVTYVKMDEDKAREMAKKHLIGGEIVEQYTIGAEEE